MPVIPETESEMDQFVNWDYAGPSVGVSLLNLPGDANNFDMDLALEDVSGDEFSFRALQHFESAHILAATTEDITPTSAGINEAMTGPVDPLALQWETPERSCENCQKRGFQCKRIREGRYKGYCTSCYALATKCSFGLVSGLIPESADFPANPWPTLGLEHPNAVPHEDFPLNPEQTNHVEGKSDSPKQGAAGKVGARFSRESVKILKNWLSFHSTHPYPNDEEKELLQRQTGLNKTQITNWLANARRRGKVHAPRSTSPHVRGLSGGIEIPGRTGTPAFENMNPLQRWAHSPPENEPADVTDIARAVTASAGTPSSGLDSPYSYSWNHSEDGSSRSLCNQSSASSFGTSGSSGNSFASAFSHVSRGSYGSFMRGRARRRRRRAVLQSTIQEPPRTSLTAPLKTFQCTFCTETFRTKHDWQRHEKSLHLSLERWVCTPKGPKAYDAKAGAICCVFCGQASPDEAHIESHSHSACQERSLDQRTFYRKDHLRQHLKLVHDVKFVSWSMEPWKVATPEIGSRCGFCGIVMDTWKFRTDHLAEHFKTGSTMADWKGDWGFEKPVLEMVENSIPPYLIHDERNSPLPHEASNISPETPRNAYELITSELAYYRAVSRELDGTRPTDDELQLEACRIIFSSEALSKQPLSSVPSWLRDLVMSSDQIALRAQLGPVRNQAESCMAVPKINGKDNLFEDCPLEIQLQEFVRARRSLGLTATDHELQTEACKIIGRMEESSVSPCEEVANVLLRLIGRSSGWLANFRQRAHLPRSEEIHNEHRRSNDPKTIDSTIHNHSRLETELAGHVKSQRLLGVEPTDLDLQRKARLIIYENDDDDWNQTAADSPDWLRAFRQRHTEVPQGAPSTAASSSPRTLLVSPTQFAFGKTSPGLEDRSTAGMDISPISGVMSGDAGPGQYKRGSFFLNDTNCYRRLERELGRFVTLTVSPNNPNCRVPSDEELQHQARWILYDDDDPWNQTAADNAEWLLRFKRGVGILPADTGPGLPEGKAWNVRQGGTGFAPPYAFPKESAETGNAVTAAERFREGLATRYPAPAVVFCSRELEHGLAGFVKAQVTAPDGSFPPDGAIRARAREIQGMEQTSADDPVLLEKFKTMMMAQIQQQGSTTTVSATAPLGTTSPQPTGVPATLPEGEVNLTMTDTEFNDILEEMNFEFGEDADLGGVNLGRKNTSFLG